MTMRNFSIVFVSMLVFSFVLTGCTQTGTAPGEDETAVLEQQAKDLLAAYSAHDADTVLSFMADNVEVVEADGNTVTGKETIRKNLEELFAMFPDLKMEPVTVFGQGDLVCVQYQATGTASGAVEGEEALAGKQVSVPAVTITEWKEGKVVRSSLFVNMAAVLTQLGVIDLPAQEQE